MGLIEHPSSSLTAPLGSRSRPLNRRAMLRQCGVGFGQLALMGMFADAARAATTPHAGPHSPLFKPRARRIIFLFMHGGPSHVDTFDYKPMLEREAGKPAPASLVEGFFD